jgi:hypothetical protein
MNHQGLLEISVAVLDSYDKNTQSIDEHVNRCLKDFGVSIWCRSNIKDFVSPIFSKPFSSNFEWSRGKIPPKFPSAAHLMKLSLAILPLKQNKLL